MSVDRLQLSDLPDPDDRDAILAFAQTFRGYEYFGSLRACVDRAELKKRDSLVDLRNELFFAYRASNHWGEFDHMVATYRELLPHFRRLLEPDGSSS